MIKIEKFVDIYEKGKLIDTQKKEIIQAMDGETARELVKNAKLNFVKNDKGLSLFEGIKTREIKTQNGFVYYYKNINYKTCREWGNF